MSWYLIHFFNFKYHFPFWAFLAALSVPRSRIADFGSPFSNLSLEFNIKAPFSPFHLPLFPLFLSKLLYFLVIDQTLSSYFEDLSLKKRRQCLSFSLPRLIFRVFTAHCQITFPCLCLFLWKGCLDRKLVAETEVPEEPFKSMFALGESSEKRCQAKKLSGVHSAQLPHVGD